MAEPKGFYCVQNIPEFRKLAETLGISGDQVFSSHDLSEDMKRGLSASSLAAASLIDSEFNDQMPKDGSVKKYAIPFTLGEGSAVFVVTAEPKVRIEPHAHSKGFIRTVCAGTLTILGLPGGELTLESGDWIYIPPGQPYGYQVGITPYIGNCCYCTNPWS